MSRFTISCINNSNDGTNEEFGRVIAVVVDETLHLPYLSPRARREAVHFLREAADGRPGGCVNPGSHEWNIQPKDNGGVHVNASANLTLSSDEARELAGRMTEAAPTT
jgi:hypothetical protein